MRTLAACLLLLPALASAEDTRRLDDATLERRVFRHIFVGHVTYPSQRLTWVLHRGGDRARLEIFCQQGKREPTKGIRLDGTELVEAYWMEPQVARYEGTRTSRSPLTYALRLESATEDEKSRCARAPAVVTLTCTQAKVSVRPAGAVLIPGGGDEEPAPGKWKPATRENLKGLRCLPASEELPLFGMLVQHPPIFVPATETSAGLEWADENSDMEAQEGAYRRIGISP